MCVRVETWNYRFVHCRKVRKLIWYSFGCIQIVVCEMGARCFGVSKTVSISLNVEKICYRVAGGLSSRNWSEIMIHISLMWEDMCFSRHFEHYFRTTL